MIYFDHAASTPLHPLVLQKLQTSMFEDFANPSASHRLGRELSSQIEEVRSLLLKRCFLKEKEFFCIFVSSASEANCQLLSSLLLEERETVWLSRADHSSLSMAGPEIFGLGSIRWIPLKNNGEVDEEKLWENLSESKAKGENPRLLALSLVNNHSGNDYTSFFEENLVKLRSSFPELHLHVDLSQAFLKTFKTPLDVDSFSLSSHKVGGPKGIAALLMRKKSSFSLRPLIRGGGQENNFRSSSLAAPLILSFGELLSIESPEFSLKDELIMNLSLAIPELRFPFKGAETSPYILTFITPEIPADMILRHLEQKDIFVATSSACSSKVNGFSEVWNAFHILPQYHKHMLRLSFTPSTSRQEIADFALIFRDIYLGLKRWLVKK